MRVAGAALAGSSGSSALAAEVRLEEAVGLARAIALDVRASLTLRIAKPRPATLFPAGQVGHIKALAAAEQAGLIIVDHPLTPVQQRNLERAWNAKVLDRTGLILEIFGERAKTREGRLQVDLAHLSYQKSRLVRSWTHLERQRGGFGFMGGPGERQIESDRRQLQDRIDAIRRQLGAVKRTRAEQRKSRRRQPFPVIALVGYTNAGKSTLFNALTGAGVLAEDQLFATLDPTMRAVALADGRRAILSDTVGFIADLPTSLIAAFRATLEEVIEADLILHVRDIAAPQTEAQRTEVEAVLAELGIDTEAADSRVLEVWNKADLLSEEERERLQNLARLRPRPPLVISATQSASVQALRHRLAEELRKVEARRSVLVDAGNGPLLHWIYEHAEVLERRFDEAGRAQLTIRAPESIFERLAQQISKT